MGIVVVHTKAMVLHVKMILHRVLLVRAAMILVAALLLPKRVVMENIKATEQFAKRALVQQEHAALMMYVLSKLRQDVLMLEEFTRAMVLIAIQIHAKLPERVALGAFVLLYQNRTAREAMVTISEMEQLVPGLSVANIPVASIAALVRHARERAV